MGIGTSIFLIALGAILRFAVADVIEGVALGTVGIILMIAGVIGLVVSLFYANMARDRGAAPPRGERTVVREREPY